MTLPDFPNNPTLNEQFAVGTNIYQWDGEKWKALSNADNSLRSQLADVDSTVLVGGVEAGDIADRVLNVKDFGAVGDGVTDDRQAFQDAVDFCSPNRKRLYIPEGEYLIGSTVFIPNTGIDMVGEHVRGSKIISNGEYTVFEHSLYVKVENIYMEQQDPSFKGIAFATAQNDNAASQAAYCIFKNFRIEGYNYSFWYRTSIWMSWENGYSRSRVGIRFARSSQAFDRGVTQSPSGWNDFTPTLGFFHNQGVVSNINFEDVECGVWGCPMGYSFISNTTQRQNGLKEDNVLLPITVEPCGMWLHSGIDGTLLWGNTIIQHYAEACKNPLRLQDQRAIIVDGMFVQGNTQVSPYLTPVYADNCKVYLQGIVGQDWFDERVILLNSTKCYGDTSGAVVGNTGSVDATSEWYRNNEYAEFVKRYDFNKSAGATGVVTLPDTIGNFSHYKLTVGLLTDGSAVRHAAYDIFRWNSDALTKIDLKSGAEALFTVSISSAQLEINLTSTVGTIGYASLEKVTDFNPESKTLTVV